VVREGQVALFERAHSGHLVMLAVLQAGAVYTSLGDAPQPVCRRRGAVGGLTDS